MGHNINTHPDAIKETFPVLVLKAETNKEPRQLLDKRYFILYFFQFSI
jgi:hypothetical protein